MELYTFQKEAIKLSIEASKNKDGSMIVIPTGCGKTRVITETVKSINSTYPKKRFLFIAHRDFLIKQAIEEFNDTIDNFSNLYGIFDAKSKNTHQRFITASKDSMHDKALENYFTPDEFDYIFIDEAHHCHDNAVSYMRIKEYFTDAKIFGYTATPISSRGKLSPIFGKKPLYQVYISDMIKQGFLCLPCGIRVSTSTDISEVRKSRTSEDGFNKKDLDKIINIEKRNKIVVDTYEKLAYGNSCIVYALNKKHVENIYNEFKERGWPVAKITEETPYHERDIIKQDLEKLKTLIVINCTILTEGFNVRNLQSIIIARPVLSIGLLTQMIGRVLRKHETKKFAKIITINDKPGKHKILGIIDIIDGAAQIEFDIEKQLELPLENIEEIENKLLLLVKNTQIKSIEVDNLFKDEKFTWVKINDNHQLNIDSKKKIEIIPNKKGFKEIIYTEIVGIVKEEWAFSTAETYLSTSAPVDLSKINKKDGKLPKLKRQKLAKWLSQEEENIKFITEDQYKKISIAMWMGLKTPKFDYHVNRNKALALFQKFKVETSKLNKIK